jgi:hypothetical protein
VYAGVDPLTRKLRNVRETAKTYDAAEVALTKLQREVDQDGHPKSDITVRQAVAQWLDVAELADTSAKVIPAERAVAGPGATVPQRSMPAVRLRWR